MFKISEFARLSGTTAIQLRHYDEIGLFRPVWVDPNSGYRFYTPAQLPELHRIIALRDVGLPLREITSLVASGADLREALSLQRRRLVGQREQLDRRLASLDIRVEMADEPGFPDVVVRRLPAELVASTRVRVGPEESLEPVFVALEVFARDAGVRAARPPGAVLHDDGSGGERDVEVYVPLIGSTPSDDSIDVRQLPAVTAATAIHRGPYESLRSTRLALDKWVLAAGYRMVDPLRLVYLQFGADTDLNLPPGFLAAAEDEFVTEIRCPVAANL